MGSRRQNRVVARATVRVEALGAESPEATPLLLWELRMVLAGGPKPCPFPPNEQILPAMAPRAELVLASGVSPRGAAEETVRASPALVSTLAHLAVPARTRSSLAARQIAAPTPDRELAIRTAWREAALSPSQ